MTLMSPPLSSPTPSRGRVWPDEQRFTFDSVDWSFYERVGEELRDRHVFVTYYKGRMEIVTTSQLHEMTSRALYRAIITLAEETDTPIISTGAMTLKRQDLEVAVEADESFYLGENVARLRGKEQIDLAIDPPPDLAIEVEITRRLGQRREIYRELGVPELWQFGERGLSIFVRRGETYEPVERSPSFPQLSPQELSGFIAQGIAEDETAWIKSFRRRLGEVK